MLTTATNRAISELTAADLCVDHYIRTELEQVDGRFTGRTSGVLNMRAGKIDRLRQWLLELGQPDRSVVRRPVVVDPDPRLDSTARRKGWTVLRLNRGR